MKVKRFLSTLLTLVALGASAPALAIDCQRAVTALENTVCTSPQLNWFDRIMNDTYLKVVASNPPQAIQRYREWEKARDVCVSDGCIKRAYMQGISNLFESNRPFDWQGQWWNSTAVNGNGGRLEIGRAADWGFHVDALAWAGVNKVTFTGEVRKFYGLGLLDHIDYADDCAILLMPRPDGTLEVSSNSNSVCNLLTPDGIAFDGVYVKTNKDPRPPATLLSIGIMPDKALDDKFRALVGEDYQNYVETANSYVYGKELDNLGATVLTLWVKGMANKRSAMIMYTRDGRIWAMRVQPAANGELKLNYVTTEPNKKQPPKTLAGWRSTFVDR